MGIGDFQIACVGKPSAGKSSFLNAITNAKAKVGNYPFTTIQPNQGVAYYNIPCPCKMYDVSENCSPKYGTCQNGIRTIPIQILDVAGLVPGASKGLGLGTQFLNDLRSAQSLIHVVDVSGTTDDNGKETINYDPINDIEWLNTELKQWVLGNVKELWSGVVRKSQMGSANLEAALQKMFSGYGTNRAMCLRILGALPGDLVKKELANWNDEDVSVLVDTFLKIRFPMVIALNKIDLPNSDSNISRICAKYPTYRFVLTSVLAESFLRKLHNNNYIRYTPVVGTTSSFGPSYDIETSESNRSLKQLDEKTKNRLSKIQDLVLYRYDSTGCHDVLRECVESMNLVPVFPVSNAKTFHALTQSGNTVSSSETEKKAVFVDCILVPSGTEVKEIARKYFSERDLEYVVYETIGGRQISESDTVSSTLNIIGLRVRYYGDEK